MSSTSNDPQPSSPPAASVENTKREIRFALNQLRIENRHHEFEHLCRCLARETIARNILPATGPVGAGGDQGRDFETYRTEVPGQIFELGHQIGFADGESLVFSCTLQQDDIAAKVRADVQRIVTCGTKPHAIIVYCETDVAVARRHQLQQETWDEHGVKLEVFDGYAITDLLAQRSLFWIAEQYLHLSARVIPPVPESAGWYQADLERWRARDEPPATFGDLVDLSGCLRYATFHEEARQDIGFWIRKMGQLAQSTESEWLTNSAMYEVAVANLRGLGDLRPADDALATYLQYAMTSDDPPVLRDAGVLLCYGCGARTRGLTNHSLEDLERWNQGLQEQIRQLLATAESPGRTCALLDALALVKSLPDLRAAAASGIDINVDPDMPPLTASDWNRIISEGPAQPLVVPLVDRSGAIEAWLSLTELLNDAPLFPVDGIADILRINAHNLADDDRFEQVVAGIDERISAVAGAAAAAGKARDRAMTYFAAGRILDCLREMHRARMGWTSGETSSGMILAMLMISQCYRQLELQSAAKHYALVAAKFIQKENTKYFPRALFMAAYADYEQGAWLSALALHEAAWRAHALLAEDPFDLSKYEELTYGLFEAAVIRAVARSAGSSYEEHVQESLTRAGILDYLDSLMDSFDVAPWWIGETPQNLQQRVLDELGHPAFSDAESTRVISWSALGVVWRVAFQNDYHTSVVAERFAAAAQIVAADLASSDPCLLPTTATIHVHLAGPSTTSVSVKSAPSDDGIAWTVEIPRIEEPTSEHVEQALLETLGVVVGMFHEVSVRPQDDTWTMVEGAMKDRLVQKIGGGSVFDFAYMSCMTEEEWERSQQDVEESLPAGCIAVPMTTSSMGFPLRPGPGYSKEEGTNLAAGRYANIQELVPETVRALQSDETFRAVAKKLRADGWIDWHILTAIMNLAINYRMRLHGQPRTEEQALQLRREVLAPEQPGDAVPCGVFTEENLRSALRMSWLSTLKNWGLELHCPTVDMEAVERLLSQRYGYWDDDSPHDDLLSPVGG